MQDVVVQATVYCRFFAAYEFDDKRAGVYGITRLQEDGAASGKEAAQVGTSVLDGLFYRCCTGVWGNGCSESSLFYSEYEMACGTAFVQRHDSEFFVGDGADIHAANVQLFYWLRIERSFDR